MDKINFQNLPSTTTPLSAQNLNQLQTNVENGIKDAGVVVSVTEPSSSNKYKIWKQHSKNLFDKSQSPIYDEYNTVTELSTGIRAKITESEGHNNIASRFLIMDVSDYVGKTFTLSAHAKSSANNPGAIYLRICTPYGGTSDTDYPVQITSTTLDGDLSKSYTIPSLSGKFCCLMVGLYATRGTEANTNDYVDYTNLQLEIGSSKTSYEPYVKEKTYILDGSNYHEELNLKKFYYNYNGYLSSSQTISNTATRINNLSALTFNTYGGNLFIEVSLPAKLTQEYTGTVKVVLDGVSTRILTIQGTTNLHYTGTLILNNVEKGKHTLTIEGQSDSNSYNLVIAKTQTLSLSIIEL